MADRLLTAATLLSLLGSLGLYAYSVSVPPVELSGPVPPDAAGTYVSISGMVREVRRSWEGSLDVELLPGGKPPGVRLSIDATLLEGANLKGRLLTGARIRASGVLERFAGKMEMQIKSAARLEFLSPSTLEVLWLERGILNGSGVALAGVAYFKNLRGQSLSFRLVERSNPSLELNCSSNSYRPSEEKRPWENGTLVRVMGLLRYAGDPPAPRLYLSGGAAGVEPLE
ncbi:MAG: hypothetical protein QXD84_00930 [Thermoplasmata archaeon]